MIFKRYLFLILGLLVNALGIVLITKSCLGTSPIASIPYVYSEVFPVSLGVCTFFLYCSMFLVQVILLGKRMKAKDWLQIPLSVIYSIFIDLCMGFFVAFHPENYGIQLGCLLIGCVLRAMGVAMQVVADEAMLSGEAFMTVLAWKTKKEFSLIKFLTDGALVLVALISSLALTGRVIGIREGTVIAVLITAPISKVFAEKMAPLLLRFLQPESENKRRISTEVSSELCGENYIVTISSQSGSGGHRIGRMLSEMLGIPVYDQEIADMIARESHYSPDYVHSHLDRIYTNRVWEFFAENYNYTKFTLDGYELLYVAQEKVVHKLAEMGSCIIFGNCSEYVLRNQKNVFSIYLHANESAKLKFIRQEYQVDSEMALEIMQSHDRDRALYFKHFTGEEWTSTDRFSMSLDTSVFGQEKSAEILYSVITKWKAQLQQEERIDNSRTN